MTQHQTTVSVLTPPGAGAIGVIRLQGSDAIGVASQIFQSKIGSISEENEASRLRFGRIVDGEETLDEGIACVSSLGETPIVDLCVHGGTRIIERVLTAAERQGALIADAPIRLADVWHTSSLIESEALETLLTARTERVARFLLHQRFALPAAVKLLPSRDARRSLSQRLEAMLALYPLVRRLLDGVTIVIVGPANSGKSTLFNGLVGRTSSVVSALEGTTRDWVSASAEFGGVPVTIIDTAGHRSPADALEEIAISRGAEIAAGADIIISMLDGSQALPDRIFSAPLEFAGKALYVINKFDLMPAWERITLEARCPAATDRILRVSAATRSGIKELICRLINETGCGSHLDLAPLLFTERQAEMARRILKLTSSGYYGSPVGLFARKLLGPNNRRQSVNQPQNPS